MNEIEALKSARNSYCYARNVLKGRFEKGEDAISKNADYSKLYKENIYDAKKELEKELKKKLEKEQKEIKNLRDSINVHYLYGVEV